MIALAAAAVCSCTKENVQENVIPVEESVVRITLQNEDNTRASGTGHGNQTSDNNIKTLEVFIFRVTDGDDDGMLDGYKKFIGSELETLTDLEIRTTTGRKMIYAVANSHKDSWTSGMTRSVFESQTAELFKDDVKDFVMVGSKEETLQLASSISMTIKRMVARVQLNSVASAFEGTPYEGSSLKNVKAYLINVQGEKYLYDGSGENLKLINSKKYVEADMTGCTMSGMLYDQLAASIDDAGYSNAHYFYCYENNRTEENDQNRFTRLVIEADLNGTTYYYPIAIKELERNCCYSIDVKIQRPGSLDPDKDVEIGTLSLDLEVLGWNSLPGSTVEF